MIAGIRGALEIGESVIDERSAAGCQRQACGSRFAKRNEMTNIIQFAWSPEDYGFR